MKKVYFSLTFILLCKIAGKIIVVFIYNSILSVQFQRTICRLTSNCEGGCLKISWGLPLKANSLLRIELKHVLTYNLLGTYGR